MSCSNNDTQNTEDTLAKINRQIARSEQCIDLLLNDIEISDLNTRGRLDCAIKIMSLYPRLLMLHERCTKSNTEDGMSEAEKTQQAALADIMRLLEEECSEERYWRPTDMPSTEAAGEGE